MLPHVTLRSEVPYSALYGLFLDAVLYRHTYKADIGVSGMAYNPSYVELNLVVSYGSIPKQKDYFHPGAMLGILFAVFFFFLYSGYKGWLVEYDWRTGIEYEKEDVAALIRGDKRKILSPTFAADSVNGPIIILKNIRKPDLSTLLLIFYAVVWA